MDDETMDYQLADSKGRPSVQHPEAQTGWAHIRYSSKQHYVVAVEPDINEAEPVRFACGRRTWLRAVWFAAPPPHLPHCSQCEGVVEFERMLEELD